MRLLCFFDPLVSIGITLGSDGFIWVQMGSDGLHLVALNCTWLLCACFAVAMCLLCTCSVVSMQLLCGFYVVAMWLLCDCYAIGIYSDLLGSIGFH